MSAMFATLFLGAGPGGLGPLVYAAQNGHLERWIDRGIAVIDRRPAPASAIAGYALLADSFGTSFLECSEVQGGHPLLARLYRSPEAEALKPYRDSRPPLSLAGAYLARLEAEIEAAVRPPSLFARRREIRKVTVEPHHVEVECITPGSDAPERWRGETAVVALGGRQTRAQAAAVALGSLGMLGDLAGERLWLADHLLTESGSREAIELLARARHQNREVVVVGGSHNAFSAAWILAERAPPGLLGEGAITVVSRRPPRIFYRSPEEALADGYRSFTEQDRCPRTGRVHQLGGLRGDGRELWRRVTGRPGTMPEPRVVLRDLGDPGEIRARLSRATLIVAACGYRPILPPIHRGGQRVDLSADAGGTSVDNRCRLVDASGASIPRLFSLGLASGFVPGGAMGGEPSFRGHTNGVWLYQHHIGARVHDEIMGLLTRRSDA